MNIPALWALIEDYAGRRAAVYWEEDQGYRPKLLEKLRKDMENRRDALAEAILTHWPTEAKRPSEEGPLSTEELARFFARQTELRLRQSRSLPLPQVQPPLAQQGQPQVPRPASGQPWGSEQDYQQRQLEPAERQELRQLLESFRSPSQLLRRGLLELLQQMPQETSKDPGGS